ncbi:HIT family protein [Nonomuraea sp. NPDC049141]|uniref:HIT family protein n=1 Tax=Nonomuraea sp. NPDC049141 TaxID=3155500 RepID=UPI0033F5CCE0
MTPSQGGNPSTIPYAALPVSGEVTQVRIGVRRSASALRWRHVGIFDRTLECPFCVLIAEGRSPVWNHLFHAENGDEVIFQTESFLVVLDTAPLAEGHLLIITDRHMPSLAGLSKTERDELHAVKRDAESKLREVYGPITYFEHGAESFTRHAGACIDHAHLHLVPGDIDMLPASLATTRISNRSSRTRTRSTTSPARPTSCSDGRRAQHTERTPPPASHNTSDVWSLKRPSPKSCGTGVTAFAGPMPSRSASSFSMPGTNYVLSPCERCAEHCTTLAR